MKLTENPLKWALGLLTGGFAILSPNTVTSLWAAVWASSGDLFTLVSLGALTLPPHIPPQTGADWAVLAVGGLFVTKVGQRVWNKFDTRL
jgi:hypothetical protein